MANEVTLRDLMQVNREVDNKLSEVSEKLNQVSLQINLLQHKLKMIDYRVFAIAFFTSLAVSLGIRLSNVAEFITKIF